MGKPADSAEKHSEQLRQSHLRGAPGGSSGAYVADPIEPTKPHPGPIHGSTATNGSAGSG
jgi:hypothetical protein